MNIIKRMPSLMKKVVLAFAGVLLLVSSAEADEIKLADNGKLEINFTCSFSNDSISVFQSGIRPDSIKINTITLSYNGNSRNKAELKIVSGSDIVFSYNSVINTLTSKEINKIKPNGLVLATNKNYLIIHDGNEWSLNFPNGTSSDQSEESAGDNPDGDSDSDKTKPENDEKTFMNRYGWVLWLLIGVVIGTISVVTLSKLKKPNSKGRKDKSNSDILSQEDNDDKIVSKLTSDTPVLTPVDKPEAGPEPTESIDKVLDQYFDGFSQLSFEAKRKRIEDAMTRLKNSEGSLRNLKKELGISEDAAVDSIITEVRKSKESVNLPTPVSNVKTGEDVCAELIELISNKNNKIFNNILANSEQECRNSKNKSFEILQRFIRILSARDELQGNKEPISGKDDFKHLMNFSDNRRLMMTWMIDQLHDNGFTGFDNRKNNRTDENFEKLANLLRRAEESEDHPSEEEVIDSAIKEDKLTVEQKGMLLERFIRKLNSVINNEDAKLKPSLSISEFVSSIAEKVQTPSSFEEAEDKVRQHDLKVVNEVLECDMSEVNKESLKAALKSIIVKLLKERFKIAASNFDDAMQKLSEATDAKEYNDLIADDLEEKIAAKDKEFVSKDKRDVIELLNHYDKLVKKEEDKLKSDISQKENEISELNTSLAKKENEITSLEDKNSELMSESATLIKTLHRGADKIMDSCKPILDPCSDGDDSLCIDIEDRLFDELNNTANKFKSFSVEDGMKPKEVRERIQYLLEDVLKDESNPINTVCRYYAYSRLPFMTDKSREYGVTFRRKNMAELYNSIETLYVQFGINLQIPDLFVMGIKEGEFENVTGKRYSDLDNLCPSSRNHFDKIDSNAKPDNVIVDVVNIGYSVDGHVRRTTSVLTY